MHDGIDFPGADLMHGTDFFRPFGVLGADVIQVFLSALPSVCGSHGAVAVSAPQDAFQLCDGFQILRPSRSLILCREEPLCFIPCFIADEALLFPLDDLPFVVYPAGVGDIVQNPVDVRQLPFLTVAAFDAVPVQFHDNLPRRLNQCTG